MHAPICSRPSFPMPPPIRSAPPPPRCRPDRSRVWPSATPRSAPAGGRQRDTERSSRARLDPTPERHAAFGRCRRNTTLTFASVLSIDCPRRRGSARRCGNRRRHRRGIQQLGQYRHQCRPCRIVGQLAGQQSTNVAAIAAKVDPEVVSVTSRVVVSAGGFEESGSPRRAPG